MCIKEQIESSQIYQPGMSTSIYKELKLLNSAVQGRRALDHAMYGKLRIWLACFQLLTSQSFESWYSYDRTIAMSMACLKCQSRNLALLQPNCQWHAKFLVWKRRDKAMSFGRKMRAARLAKNFWKLSKLHLPSTVTSSKAAGTSQPFCEWGEYGVTPAPEAARAQCACQQHPPSYICLCKMFELSVVSSHANGEKIGLGKSRQFQGSHSSL